VRFVRIGALPRFEAMPATGCSSELAVFLHFDVHFCRILCCILSQLVIRFSQAPSYFPKAELYCAWLSNAFARPDRPFSERPCTGIASRPEGEAESLRFSRDAARSCRGARRLAPTQVYAKIGGLN
jgi:hypothetical protein